MAPKRKHGEDEGDGDDENKKKEERFRAAFEAYQRDQKKKETPRRNYCQTMRTKAPTQTRKPSLNMTEWHRMRRLHCISRTNIERICPKANYNFSKPRMKTI